LLAAGVRSGGIDVLVITINDWIDENKGDLATKPEPGADSNGESSIMLLPDTAFQPEKPWEFFVYRPQKKTGLASWESSYNRFTAGEHPQTIAISPISGRPIQVNTVIGHIFDGILSGLKVDLRRLSTLSTPPTKSHWDALSCLEVETDINVVGDPKTSGKNGEIVRMSDFLAPIMGEEFVAKDFNDRTLEEKAKFGEWCQYFKWYSSLRRIGFTPSFEAEDSTPARNDLTQKIVYSSAAESTKFRTDMKNIKFVDLTKDSRERKRLRSSEVEPAMLIPARDTAIIDLTMDAIDDDDA